VHLAQLPTGNGGALVQDHLAPIAGKIDGRGQTGDAGADYCDARGGHFGTLEIR
jgi:hypothetical protein